MLPEHMVVNLRSWTSPPAGHRSQPALHLLWCQHLLKLQQLRPPCWPSPVAIRGVARPASRPLSGLSPWGWVGPVSFTLHRAASAGLPWLAGLGWHKPSGSSSADSSNHQQPSLPACGFEVSPRAWLCRAAPRPVIRHIHSGLHLLIMAKSAGTLASPQTTFPRPRGGVEPPSPEPPRPWAWGLGCWGPSSSGLPGSAVGWGSS